MAKSPLIRGPRKTAQSLRVLFASVGRKPGEDLSIAMLLDDDDVASNHLRKVQQRTFRTPLKRTGQPEDEVPVGFESVTATRFFIGLDGTRGMQTNVAPCRSVERAQLSVRNTYESYVAAPYATSAVRNARKVEAVEIPGCDVTFAHEHQVIQLPVVTGIKVLAGSVHNVWFLTQFSSTREGWSWEESLEVAAKQATKIRQSVENG